MKTVLKLSLLTAVAALIFSSLTVHAGNEGWLKNYDEALAQAKAEGKHLLVEFHGSDWCPPCIKLNKEVLTEDAFKELAEASLVLVDVDFPRKSKLPEAQSEHNDALAKKLGVRYFPTVLIIDSEGNVLDKMVGFPEGGLKGFLKFITDQTDKES